MNSWLNLILAIATGYVVIWYVFKPTDNQCQMTFMMEPPKFIPIPVDEIKDQTQSKKKFKTQRQNDNYKLFMYSEFGFPLVSDLRRDLKDSMPVIFVPGNAGSYQQVRSIASTCIRLQLQSLEAHKFIFYTIDFQGQLSGVDGQLIENQIDFLHRSVNQVIGMHPSEMNGVILIGHSVGGFISKALFTTPNFNPDSVPLLISLASPLTSPYLNFDGKMKQLYDKTNEYWSNKNSKSKTTISLSINGGRSDYMVPMHLSMDKEFDLSVSTTSIKDVWLTSDHVSVTWCRELMHKLAHLLSALMDKKRTRIIEDKKQAISTIENNLLVSLDGPNLNNKPVIIKDWILSKPYINMELNEFYSAHRSELSDNVIILQLKNKTKNKKLLILIDYLSKLKSGSIFGCESVDHPSNEKQVRCKNKTDLFYLSQSIPSRRFEPKRTAIFFSFDDHNQIDYIIIDFYKHGTRTTSQGRETVPESISIQQVDESSKRKLRIPSFWEFIFTNPLNQFSQEIVTDKKSPVYYARYELDGFKQRTQTYTIKYEAKDCDANDVSSESKILFYQGRYLSETFLSPIKQNDTQIKVKIRSQPSILNHDAEVQHSQFHLDFYIDGRCSNLLTIELDFLELTVEIIQKNLDKILVFATYFAYTSIVASVFENFNQIEPDYNRQVIKLLTNISGFLAIYQYFAQISVRDDLVDELNILLMVCILSIGTRALIRFLLNRMTDLATIMINVFRVMGNKIADVHIAQSNNGISTNGTGAAKPSSDQPVIDLEWPFMIIIVAGSVALSNAIISIAQLLLMTRMVFLIQNENQQDSSEAPKQSNNNSELASKKRKLKQADLSISIMELARKISVLSALGLISNIPEASIMYNSQTLNLGSINQLFDIQTLIVAGSLFVVKLMKRELDLRRKKVLSPRNDKTGNYQSMLRMLCSLSHITALLPIILIAGDIRYINLAQFIVLCWTLCYIKIIG